MALRVKNAPRVFIIKRKSKEDNVKLEDPNPNMEVKEVMRFYSGRYPELTTSSVKGPKMREGSAEYEFQTIIGDKG